MSGQGSCSPTLNGWCPSHTGRRLRRGKIAVSCKEPTVCPSDCPAGSSRLCVSFPAALAICPQCNLFSVPGSLSTIAMFCSSCQGCCHHRDFVAGPERCLHLFFTSCDPSFDPPLGLLVFLWCCRPYFMCQSCYPCQAHACPGSCSSSGGHGDAAVLASGCQLMDDGGACARSSCHAEQDSLWPRSDHVSGGQNLLGRS